MTLNKLIIKILPSTSLETLTTKEVKVQINLKVYFNFKSECVYDTTIDKSDIATVELLTDLLIRVMKENTKREDLGEFTIYYKDGAYLPLNKDNLESVKRYSEFIALPKVSLQINIDVKDALQSS